MDYIKIEEQAIQDINSVTELSILEKIRVFYLGKKGIITLKMKELGSLSIDQKKHVGKELNLLKSSIQNKLEQKKILLEILSKRILYERVPCKYYIYSPFNCIYSRFISFFL